MIDLFNLQGRVLSHFAGLHRQTRRGTVIVLPPSPPVEVKRLESLRGQSTINTRTIPDRINLIFGLGTFVRLQFKYNHHGKLRLYRLKI